jgi:hypothetical protein
VGVSFVLGCVIYLAIIFGLTFWLFKYHSLKCRNVALEKNATEVSEKTITDQKPSTAGKKPGDN